MVALSSLPANYIAKIEPQGDCWAWVAYKNKSGYGRVRLFGRLTLAHRAVYVLLVGPIPEGLTLDHLCRNPPCVNPAHLEPVTMRINALRGVGPTAINAAKVFCIRGHRLVRGTRQRICKICADAAHKALYERAAGQGPRSPRRACNRGHAFDAGNTIVHHGRQLCRTCARERMKRFKENRRAKARI